MLGAGMHDEAFNLQRVAVLLAPRTGRSEAFPLAQVVVGSTVVADALSKMSRLRNATTVSPPLERRLAVRSGLSVRPMSGRDAETAYPVHI
jgi:hypothetical protein